MRWRQRWRHRHWWSRRWMRLRRIWKGSARDGGEVEDSDAVAAAGGWGVGAFGGGLDGQGGACHARARSPWVQGAHLRRERRDTALREYLRRRRGHPVLEGRGNAGQGW